MFQLNSTCPGCKVILPITDYPADNRYGILSAECRQKFDEVLVREGELFGYPSAHRLVIDSYAVQHPPHSAIQQKLNIAPRFVEASIQSISIHLIALYLATECKKELRSIAGEILLYSFNDECAKSFIFNSFSTRRFRGFAYY